MCKLAYASNLKKLSLTKKQKLFNHIQKTLTQSDRSGYGIAAKSFDGKIDIKRTLSVTDLITQDLTTPSFCKPIGNGDFKVGRASEVIFHARTSTNSVSIENTHPFQIGSTILCHNGVLDYNGENYPKQTDNDTEDLTYHFDKFHMTNIDQAFNGYAAFIAFKNDSTYIVRDNTATLFYSYSKVLDCHFFGTTKNIVSEILSNLGLKSRILEVNDNQYIEIRDNKIVDSKLWSGLKFSSYASSKSHLSLGYSSKFDTSFNDNQNYNNWINERYGSSVSLSKTEVKAEKSPVLEYIGKFSEIEKTYFTNFTDVSRAIEAGEIIVKNKGTIISHDDFGVLDSDSISSLDVYWAC